MLTKPAAVALQLIGGIFLIGGCFSAPALFANGDAGGGFLALICLAGGVWALYTGGRPARRKP